MINGRSICVVLPAYNAARTLRSTFEQIPKEIVDYVILVDDHSRDETVEIAKTLGIQVVIHPRNLGYGANQKTCYREALKRGADIVVMLHPDYQYTPALIPSLASLIAYGEYDVALGSRILGKGATRGGMPIYKYLSNRVLTLIQNILMSQKLSEYHTGYRAFRRDVLETLPLADNSDDFVFDNEMLAQALFFGYRVGEVSCPTRYDENSSSINFIRSVQYGFGVLAVSVKYFLQRRFSKSYRLFERDGRRLAGTSGDQ